MYCFSTKPMAAVPRQPAAAPSVVVMATCAADLCGSQFVNLHAIEQAQLWAQRRVDGAGRLKFDFRTAVDWA